MQINTNRLNIEYWPKGNQNGKKRKEKEYGKERNRQEMKMRE